MATDRKAQFKALLDGYHRWQTSNGRDIIKLSVRLLEGFNSAHECGKKLQATSADDFNLLDTLQVANEEIRHSMLLAWLLRRDDTHAQGNLGFKLFLAAIGFSSEYAKTPYRVIREKCGEESRVDVEVSAPGKFIIHIENKIFSEEGVNQTQREWKDLQRRARELNVPATKLHGLYLTLDGHQASCVKFQSVSWKQIADVLDEFAELSKADQVALFAAHYAQALRRMTYELTQDYEDKNETRPVS